MKISGTTLGTGEGVYSDFFSSLYPFIFNQKHEPITDYIGDSYPGQILYECGSIRELKEKLNVNITSEDRCMHVEKYGEKWKDVTLCYCHKDLCNNANIISLNLSFLVIHLFLIVYNWILA